MRFLSSITLSDNQKRVMCKIIAAPTPKVAAEEIDNDQNLVANRDVLIRLGLITYSSSAATVTDKGMQALKDEALIDDAGQLSPDGEQFAHTNDEGKPEQGNAEQPPPTSDITGDMMGGSPEQAPPGGLQLQSVQYEKFRLLKELFQR
jgi:hypothetical protein